MRKAAEIHACMASVAARRSSGMARKQRHKRSKQRQDEDPQKHRALVVPPHAGDFIDKRLGGMRILDHIDERKIRHDMRMNQRCKGDGDKHELHHRGRRRDRHQLGVAFYTAPERQHSLNERQRKGEDESVVANFDGHWVLLANIGAGPPGEPSFQTPCFLSAATTSRGI